MERINLDFLTICKNRIKNRIHISSVTAILSNGLNPNFKCNMKSQKNISPLLIALQNGDVKLADVLVSYGANITLILKHPIYESIMRNPSIDQLKCIATHRFLASFPDSMLCDLIIDNIRSVGTKDMIYKIDYYAKNFSFRNSATNHQAIQAIVNSQKSESEKINILDALRSHDFDIYSVSTDLSTLEYAYMEKNLVMFQFLVKYIPYKHIAENRSYRNRNSVYTNKNIASSDNMKNGFLYHMACESMKSIPYLRMISKRHDLIDFIDTSYFSPKSILSYIEDPNNGYNRHMQYELLMKLVKKSRLFRKPPTMFTDVTIICS